MRLNNQPQRKRPRVEMVPMIDVVFLLLVFFIYAMLSMVVHHGLPVQLPEASAAERDQRDHVSVSIDKDNQLFVNRQPVTQQQIVEAVINELAGRDNVPVSIGGDRRADYGIVFYVLEQLRAAGVREISLQSAERSQ